MLAADGSLTDVTRVGWKCILDDEDGSESSSHLSSCLAAQVSRDQGTPTSTSPSLAYGSPSFRLREYHSATFLVLVAWLLY